MRYPWQDILDRWESEEPAFPSDIGVLLGDAEALLQVARKLQEHQSNIPLILEGDNAIEVAQWFDQGTTDALAALPEHLR